MLLRILKVNPVFVVSHGKVGLSAVLCAKVLSVRIAVNTRFLLSGQLEGFGWYSHEILKRMVAEHPEEEFIFFFDRSFDPKFVYGPNITPVVLYPPARHPVLFWIWFELLIPWALWRYKADVFFSPDSMCSLRSKTPTVMTCHDLVPLHFPEQIEKRHRGYLLKFLPKWLQRADHLLSVSTFVKNDIAQTCGILPEKISAVYNGCRADFHPLSETEKKDVRDQFAGGSDFFFYAGAIHPRKNVHRLIRAFDLFRKQNKSNAKLLLAGRFAWQTGEVLSAWEAAAYKEEILFLGYVREGDLPRLTASALASVYVSISEGFGLPLLEAMSSGTPVITSNISCLPEIAGDAAMLVDPFSEEDIAAALTSMIREKDFREQLIQKGSRRCKDFSWEGAAEQIYQILRTTAQQQ
jgi:glycosyltransferase involved in cell wall biosynthesis